MVCSGTPLPLFYQNPKVQHRECLLDWILSKFHPPPTLTMYFPKIHLNGIQPSPSRSSKWTFNKRFSTKILYVFLVSLILVTFPVHRSLLDLTTLTVLSYES
jgi:hypothetical protein